MKIHDVEKIERDSKGSAVYFILPDVHVFEMCFTFSTLSVACCCVLPASVPGVPLGAFEAVVVDPVIATSWPMCSLNFAVSPWSW